MQDGLSTKDAAQMMLVKEQTLRKRYCETGSYFGVVPQKLPNRRLLWPHDSIDNLLKKGGA